jgi:hypothetical protein
LSRLFDSFGEGADEPSSPKASPLAGEAGPAMPETLLFSGDSAAEAPVYDPAEDAAFDEALLEPLLDPMLKDQPATAGSIKSPEPHSLDGLGQPLAAPAHYDIPDFEKDAKDLEGYEDAKRRYQRQQLAHAESAIQTSFSQKREQLQREIKNGRTFEEERRTTASYTTRQYANAYPTHVDKKGVNPPTLFENVFSFGRAGRLYRAAFIAIEALAQLREAMRKREEQLGALDDQMKRALYLKEEAIKKSLESDSGLNEFHDRPEIRPIHKRVEKIRKERAEFAKRLERGVVSDEEQRDRAMSEQKLTHTTLPIMGAIIGKVARFGNLSYFQLRDLEKKESLLSYDPRLDPLRNCVFDIYSVAGTVAAKLRRNDNGTAFRVADHFKACWRNQEKAEELYGQHRAALREDRGLMPMEPRDASEAEIVERLAALSAMVDGGQSRQFSDAGTPQGVQASQ